MQAVAGHIALVHGRDVKSRQLLQSGKTLLHLPAGLINHDWLQVPLCRLGFQTDLLISLFLRLDCRLRSIV